jgi:hypothetical protein
VYYTGMTTLLTYAAYAIITYRIGGWIGRRFSK